MLTSIKIEHLKPEAKTKRYTNRNGLTLEVRPSGKKVFIFRFQWCHKPQTITLGRYPALSLAESRNLATKYRCNVDNGVDPRAIIRGTEKSEQTLFKNIAERWYSKHCPKWRSSTVQNIDDV